MPLPLIRYVRLRRVPAAIVAVLLFGGVAAASAADGPYPGLPRPRENGGWAGAAQTGIAESAKARQWLHVPMQAVAVYTSGVQVSVSADDPRESSNRRTNYIYLVSPSGSEYNYGLSLEFTVRTVAFGAVPVEATVQLIQRRDGDFPVPILSQNYQDTYKVIPPGRPHRIHETDTLIEDQITMRVNRLVVDGVDLGLAARCQTAEPGRLSLFGKGAWSGEPGLDTMHPWATGNYLGGAGGILTGTVDVPPFTNCLTATGEDISALLTTTVSGPGNRVKIHASAPACNRPLPPPVVGIGPPPPGATTPEQAGCLPDRIPPEIPIP